MSRIKSNVRLAPVVFFVFITLAVSSVRIEQHPKGLESSLGQLSKNAQSVFIGELETVTTTPQGLLLRVSSCKTLLGNSLAIENQVLVDPLTGSVDDSGLKASQQIIVFSALTPFDPLNLRAYRWNYKANVSAVAPSSNSILYAVGGRRGIIDIESSDTHELIESIKSYWALLRGDERDIYEYARFLSSATTSRVERVSNDAHLDLLLLIRFADKETLYGLRKYELLSEEVESYFEKILAWKEIGEPQSLRDVTRTSYDLAEWIELLRHGTAPTRMRVMAEMLRPERRSWIISECLLWRDELVVLLTDDNPNVRGFASFLLNSIGEERAIPVMIEMLKREDNLWRRTAWTELKNKYNIGVSYDPDALPNIRNNDIEAINMWFKEHGIGESKKHK